MEHLEERIATYEKANNLNYERDEAVLRVKADLLDRGLLHLCRFSFCPDHYYTLSLQQRSDIVNAAGPSSLCKTIIFENSASDFNDIGDLGNSRYFIVVVQYERKIDSEALNRLVHSLRTDRELSKKKFHLALCPEETSYKLSGFKHNAVCPFGMPTKVPVIIDESIFSLKRGVVFIGGGRIDVKLSLPVKSFAYGLNAHVAPISRLRSPAETSTDQDL